MGNEGNLVGLSSARSLWIESGGPEPYEVEPSWHALAAQLAVLGGAVHSAEQSGGAQLAPQPVAVRRVVEARHVEGRVVRDDSHACGADRAG